MIPNNKERTCARVLKEAAKAIRAEGPHRVGVAAMMAKAGLTHGGFYAHFRVKDDLVCRWPPLYDCSNPIMWPLQASTAAGASARVLSGLGLRCGFSRAALFLRRWGGGAGFERFGLLRGIPSLSSNSMHSHWRLLASAGLPDEADDQLP